MDILKSRGFWTLLLGVTPPICAALGMTSEQTAIVASVIGMVAGYFGVTAVRSLRGMPSSYAQAHKL